jgi:hypothetical protein
VFVVRALGFLLWNLEFGIWDLEFEIFHVTARHLFMHTRVNDSRQAAWLKRSASSSVVGLILALGIGAGTIVFTVMHASLLNSVPSNAGTPVSSDQTTSKSIPNETLRAFIWESFPSLSHLADESNSSKHICAFHSALAPVVKRNVARRSATLAARAGGRRKREVLTTRYQVQKGNGNGQPNKRHPLCAS